MPSLVSPGSPQDWKPPEAASRGNGDLFRPGHLETQGRGRRGRAGPRETQGQRASCWGLRAARRVGADFLLGLLLPTRGRSCKFSFIGLAGCWCKGAPRGNRVARCRSPAKRCHPFPAADTHVCALRAARRPQSRRQNRENGRWPRGSGVGGSGLCQERGAGCSPRGRGSGEGRRGTRVPRGGRGRELPRWDPTDPRLGKPGLLRRHRPPPSFAPGWRAPLQRLGVAPGPRAGCRHPRLSVRLSRRRSCPSPLSISCRESPGDPSLSSSSD